MESVVFDDPILQFLTIYASGGSHLEGGRHQFPFSITLPNGIPSSFEGDHGQVRHVCKATLKMSGFFKMNVKQSQPYSVVSIHDLNLIPNARVGLIKNARSISQIDIIKFQNPILASDEKTLCCWCCASGPLSILLNIDRNGFVPGENIVINAECSNKSSREMKGTRAELLQVYINILTFVEQ